MAVSARLSRTLHQALGDEGAEDMVNWMQQVDQHSSELRAINDLNYARFESMLDAKLAKLDAKFAQLDANIERRYTDLLKWSLMFWVGAVGSIAVLAGILG